MKIFCRIFLILLLPLPAQAFSLAWPVNCIPGRDCLIQNYVDRDPGPGMKDFTCGTLVYENGHDGTDIRLRDLAAMRKGVAVLAAADGTVFRTRDEMDDVASDGLSTNHRDCGNAIILNHADGWQTIYCHLRKGSVAVKVGQKVKAGETLGMVGMSGMANFPHLHFSVKKDGKTIDPFDGQPMQRPCSVQPASLWQAMPSYQPAALLNDGFVEHIPDKAAMRDTPEQIADVDICQPTLVYWADLMGTRVGDKLTMRIEAPNGSTLVEKTQTLDTSSPFFFTFIGKTMKPPYNLQDGTYRAILTLERDKDAIVQTARDVPSKSCLY